MYFNNFFTNFWHSRDKSDFLPILQKMQNITIIYERNACQFRLKYTWLSTSVHHIMNGKRPCKSNRPKERAKILDYFDHCVIKRTIHGLYSRKIAPTV
jgi:hypothetical protein